MDGMCQKIYSFINKVDQYFPVPLSKKTDLLSYSKKLYEKGTLFAAYNDKGEIVSLVAGYIDHAEGGIGYISLVATLDEARKQGYAHKLIRDFLVSARQKGLSAVHLYTSPDNQAALSLYRSMGFEEYYPQVETRPLDTHLICNLEVQNK